MRASRLLKVVVLVLVAALVFAGGIVAGVRSASAQSGQSADPGPHHAQDVVDNYLGILNNGMSGTGVTQCDFSALSTVYATDARLTLTGGPFGPGGPPFFGTRGSLDELQYHGVTNIIGFYTTFCNFLNGPHGPGYGQWTQDAGYLLSPNVLDSYEHVTLSRAPQVGRCMHVFTISGDKIVSLDWSVYE